ncbi:Late embryogenesis abundant (LEA) hydroxyproline-rich glycoprotein family [Thalictrum thalictroides]|uniref:Late embryogenesis abundant (LEA) hydroxyproline-rich glycoprotein family n=1 Tax=Thalictrum thalictroides TaxID=46969 RepID=A0A7J6WWB2_THATH|nr:Late embryogenesis abundant (LEA) hydroxyproline-rich glycoprotein family [Thalictrum thalictroides]
MEKTEEQSLNKRAIEVEGQQRKSMKKPFYKRPCCGITTAIILLLLITIIILIFTVFKPKDPKITLLSTTVSGIAPRVIFPTLQVELNITLDLKLSVKNKNYASFKYGDGVSVVNYRCNRVGDVDVEPGRMGSRSTGTVEARLTLEAEKFNMTSFVSDVLAGQLSFEIRTRLPGRVTIIGFIKKHIVALSNCQVDIQIPSFVVSRQQCKNKAKL